jgi:membrane protein
MSVLARSLRDFSKDGGVTYAGSLAYFFIVSIVPLFLFVITVLSYVLGGQREFYDYLVDEVLALFPEITRGFTAELRKLITFRAIGNLSLLIFAVVSFELYRQMQVAIQAIFKVVDRRPILNSVAVSIVVICSFVFLMFAAFSLSTMVPLLKALDEYFPVLEIGTRTAVLMRFVLPLLIVLSTAVFMYMVLPRRRIRLRDAFWGGLFTTVMMEAAKHLFTFYVSSIRNIGAVYGSLSAFVAFLLWVYFSAAIFLVGGEIVHNVGEYADALPRRRATDRIRSWWEAV